MYRLVILQCLLQGLLQSCFCINPDLGALTLLSYSTAVDRNVWGETGQEAVGQSQKYEQFLPPPPGFQNSNHQTFGLKERPSEEATHEQQQLASRAPRKFETFRRKQEEEMGGENAESDQNHWRKIYDTFNSWNDGDENDDWNNHFDHEEHSNDNLDRYDNWNDNERKDSFDDDKDIFANFQFEIKKLNQMYSGARTDDKTTGTEVHHYPNSRVRNFQQGSSSYGNDRNDFRAKAEEDYRVNNQIYKQSSEDNKNLSWNKARNTKRKQTQTRQALRGEYNEASDVEPKRMHRPITGETPSSVLPQTYDAPTSYQTYNRRVSSEVYNNNQVQEDFTYDETPQYKREKYMQALKDFKSTKVVENTKAPYTSQFYAYDDPSQTKITAVPKSKDYPYSYQRPVFNEPVSQYERKPTRKVEKLMKQKVKDERKEKVEKLRKSKDVRNTYIDLDESTRILSEPQPSTYTRSSQSKPSSYTRSSQSTSLDPLNGESPSLSDRRRGVRRVESVDSQRGESLHHHGVADHHGGLEAAVHAGVRHYQPERYQDPQRLSFQIHGQEGPHSYRFGHDTGIGHNRQFRYEERTEDGVVHGRYGYYDQHGKLNIVNYTADPYNGFHAEGEHVPKPQYK